jgi:hypothetical protein
MRSFRQIFGQRLGRGGVLGRTLPKPQWMFDPIHVDAHHRQHQVLGEVHAVEQQLDQLELAQIASHQFSQSASGTDQEPLADGALADSANLNLLGQAFKTRA